jgi:hypothetical protein
MNQYRYCRGCKHSRRIRDFPANGTPDEMALCWRCYWAVRNQGIPNLVPTALNIAPSLAYVFRQLEALGRPAKPDGPEHPDAA